MKQLDRLLFEQGGDCFFCGQPLAKTDASIEHLHAQANGGTNADENLVACCKALNALLGSKPLKEKFAIILRQKQGFRCPADRVATELAESINQRPLAKPTSPPAPVTKTARPGPTAKKAARLPAPPAAAAISGGTSAVTCPTCHASVPSSVGQVDYVCPKCHGAFRY